MHPLDGQIIQKDHLGWKLSVASKKLHKKTRNLPIPTGIFP